MQGRLKCLGSSTHMKQRFGGGYLLEVHCADNDDAQARLAAFIGRELGGEETEDRHFGRAKFRLPIGGKVKGRYNSLNSFPVSSHALCCAVSRAGDAAELLNEQSCC